MELGGNTERLHRLQAFTDAALAHLELDELLDAMLVRIREILEWRISGIEALATAVAMQPGIDAERLHRDFLAVLKARFESMRHVPSELKDMAAAIQLAASERK